MGLPFFRFTIFTIPPLGLNPHNLEISKNREIIFLNSDRDIQNKYAPTTLIKLGLDGNILRSNYYSEIYLESNNFGARGNYGNRNDFSLTADTGFIVAGFSNKDITRIVKTNKNGTTECNVIDTSIVRTETNISLDKIIFKSGPGFALADIKINSIPIKYRKTIQCADRFYPDAFLNNDTVICSSAPYILNVKQTVQSKYFWSNGDTTSSLEITKPGKYWVSITSGFCTVSDTVNILFHNQLAKLKTKTAAICPYDSFLLQAPDTTLPVRWQTPTGSILWGKHIWIKDTGNYILSLTNSQTCKNIDTFRLFHHPLPKSSAGPDTLLCYNQSYEMQGKGGIKYKWIPAKYLSNDTIANPIAKAPNQQLYMLVVKNAFGCADTSQMWLKVKPKLQVKLSAQTFSVCSGEIVQLQAKASGGDSLHYTFTWNNSTVTDSVFNAQLHKSSLIKVTLNDGCSEPASDSIFILVKPTPIAAFYTNPKDSAISENTIQFINQSIFSNNYIWNFGNGEISYSQNPTYIFTDTGKYFVTLIATNSSGCSDTAFGNIYIGEKFRIFIPNAFSPDNDLVNDVFSVYGTGIKSYSYEIYNRWGAKIFTSNNLNKLSWNGAVENKGETVQMDVYFYVLKVRDIENSMHYLNGSIHLLK
ncbi:MAG: T9SS type B sorting domain-containing protein [Sphingobacteriales bacterium]|nr:MAG: T9SS type B sorting domain-containing protein [Sphingobacteriales bacterium]